MPESPEREEALLRIAIGLSAKERLAFLEATCTGDVALRARLEALLAAHEHSPAKPGEPAGEGETTRPESPGFRDAAGRIIGPYKLLEKIGEGGFGVVFAAEQREPVKRRVALKIIKLGMDTRQVVARFEAERQALAMMDHPNIAKVLDAGATDSGRPYFVMELVRGIRVTEYCDQNKFATKQRVELFIQICNAIQHAHQKGIIHRDIKPSNILVTLHDGIPVPKVIDFGIAKATQQELTDKTLYTQLQQFIGTPAYMSPEQAEMSGLDVDTRSDIYSLGVLLYELLTGRTPFDPQELMKMGVEGMRKTIREKEPQRPSTKLATLQGEDLTTTATRHSAEGPKLVHLLRGDLDWIVMKCLEKDRTRRYETANGLAVDIKRHLNNEPVAARPPSRIYRFQKSIRRNKLAFVASMAVAAALLLGVVASTWQAMRATDAKRHAQASQASEIIQRQQAVANEQKAIQAQAAEAKLRDQAQKQELAARQRAYASDMNVAKQALDGDNLGRALDLLDRQRPQAGQRDLRGWEWRYLWQQTHGDALYTLCRQSNEIESLAASADGRWLAIGVDHVDGLFVYDLQTRQPVAHLALGEGSVWGAFSPTEPLLAFASRNLHASGNERFTLRFWNAATHQMMAELPLDDLCGGLAFGNDGRTLVTSTGRSLVLWRMPEGTRLATYSGGQRNPAAANSFAATSDLRLAAYGTWGGQLHLVDLSSGKELWKVAASNGFITALAFSPDGKTLASAAGFSESDIRLWNVAAGTEIGRLQGHSSWVGALVFWPDGQKLASCSADQTIRIWNPGTHQCLDVLRGHRLEVWRLALLPDNKTLVSGSKDGEVCAWDTSITHPRNPRITIPDNVVDWCFSPDSQSVLTFNSQGQVKRWTGIDFQQSELLLKVRANTFSINRRNRDQNRSYFSDDGRFIAGVSADGNVSVWDLSRRVLWREFKPGNGRILPLVFLAKGKRLLIWSQADNRLSEWDLESTRQIQSWPAPVGYEGVGVSPNERLAVAVGFDGQVICRDLQNHTSTTLPLDALEGWTVAFSPDGRALAMSSALGYARVWDTATWREEATLHGFLNAVGQAVFSPDLQRLATSGSNPDDALKLWSGDARQEVLTLEGAGHEGSDLTGFSPDGNMIGVMSGDGILSLWRAPSMAEIRAAEEGTGPSPEQDQLSIPHARR